MLNGIRVWTSDDVWRKILTDLGAVCVAEKILSDIDLDSVYLPERISVFELKSAVLSEIDKNQNEILHHIFKSDVILSRLQMQIIILLYKTNGLSLSDLRGFLGYAPNVATHAVDTAIYQLRKKYGREFIINQNEKYSIGKL